MSSILVLSSQASRSVAPSYAVGHARNRHGLRRTSARGLDTVVRATSLRCEARSVRSDVLLDQRPGPQARHRPDQDGEHLRLFARDLGQGVLGARILHHAGCGARRAPPADVSLGRALLRIERAFDVAAVRRLRPVACPPTPRPSFKPFGKRCSPVAMRIAPTSEGGFCGGSTSEAAYGATRTRCRPRVRSSDATTVTRAPAHRGPFGEAYLRSQDTTEQCRTDR